MSVVSHLKRIFEEILPFSTFLCRAHEKWCLVNKSDDILQEEKFKKYSKIDIEKLKERLVEERERASSMDEKTFKLTLSLSIALAILGSTSITLTKFILHPYANKLFIILISISIFFFTISGFIAINSVKTLPMYGRGTEMILTGSDKSQKYLAEYLAKNEEINQIRHLRNESAYQSLRNGFILFIGAIILFVYSLVWDVFQDCGFE